MPTTYATSDADTDPGPGLFDPWIRDIGWVKNQDPVEQTGPYFRELRNNFLG